MKVRTTYLLPLALLPLALAACGGTSTPGVGVSAGGERAPYVPCDDPAQVRIAPHVCWNPEGSRWRVTAGAPGGELNFDLELMPGGRVRSSDDAAGGPATDEWFVQEDILRVFLANRYVEYRGRLSNGSLIVGDVTNVRGDVWDFRAVRQHGGSCAAGELVVNDGGADPACYSAAGSHWTVTVRGTSFVVDLGAGGALTSDNPTDTTVGNDTWTQAGAQLTLRFDDGAAEYSATLRPGALGRLEGNGHDGAGSFSFTATAVPTYPPPIR